MTDLPEDINQDILDVLKQISEIAWSFHDTKKPYDAYLCITLGQISSICDRAIEAYHIRTEFLKEQINDQ